MPDYNIDEIIEAWKEEGRPPYTTFHKKRLEGAKREGSKFPALETFRKALVKNGLIESKKRSKVISSSESTTLKIDDEYLEFLKENLRDEVKQNPELSFMKWRIERLEEENRRLRAETTEE